MKNTSNIVLREEFKKQTTKAALSIVFFIIVYILLIIFGVGLTIAGMYLSIALIMAAPSILTILIGIGVGSLGIFVLIFLLKFLFASKKVDRRHLKEIKEKDEPKLFQLIKEIVEEVGTDFPKKVYLSGDVNAAVFYDSSFWSMFFPIKKNLQIGIGLVNTVSKSELKAILAHEFGHFSQRSMKLGSYVYNVNQIIHNLLFENDDYDQLVQGWTNGHAFISFFAQVAMRINWGIQWILQKMYNVVNKSYMSLSREMEFHADEVAASVVGIEPIKSSLLRMSLADFSFNSVLSFYDGKVYHNQRSPNIYKEQTFIMNFLAEENNIKVIKGLPYVSEENINQFNQSKLIIDDQWASHPSVEERIKRLESLNIQEQNNDSSLAIEMLSQHEITQEERTTAIFKDVKYNKNPTLLKFEDFKLEFLTDYKDNLFPKIFNGYYSEKNPEKIELSSEINEKVDLKFEELFSAKNKNLVSKIVSLENDIEVIKQIDQRLIPVKTFDYDGKKYSRKEVKLILPNLEKEVAESKKQILENDLKIFQYFIHLEKKSENQKSLVSKYQSLFEYEDTLESMFSLYKEITDDLQFIHYSIPIDQIHQNLKKIKVKEHTVKGHIEKLLNDDKCQNEITPEIRENFELYLSKDWQYFGNTMYFDRNLQIFHLALNNFVFIASRKYFLLKKDLLEYQERLHELR